MRMPGPTLLVVLSVVLLAGCGAQQAPSGQGAEPGGANGQVGTDGQAGAASAANGIEKLPAQEALSRAKKAFIGAPGVHVVFSARAEKTTADIQLQGNDRASVSMAKEGETVKVTVVGSVAYLRTKDLGDQWIKTSTSDKDYAKFSPLTKRDQLFQEFVTNAAKPPMTSGPGGKVNGHDSVKLASGTVAIYLATDADPYPLRVVDTADNGGTVDFIGYGTQMAITEPPASKVVSGSRPGARSKAARSPGASPSA